MIEATLYLFVVLFWINDLTGSVTLHGKNYVLFPDTHSWNEVNEICSTSGLNMLKIGSDEEQALLLSFVGTWKAQGHINDDVWLGLHDSDPSNSVTYEWNADCSPIQASPPWADWEPNEQATDFCIRITSSGIYKTWNCKSPYHAICETNKECWFHLQENRRLGSTHEQKTVDLQTCIETCKTTDFSGGSECLALDFRESTGRCRIQTGVALYTESSLPAMSSNSNFDVYVKLCYKGERRALPASLTTNSDSIPNSKCSPTTTSPTASTSTETKIPSTSSTTTTSTSTTTTSPSTSTTSSTTTISTSTTTTSPSTSTTSSTTTTSTSTTTTSPSTSTTSLTTTTSTSTTTTTSSTSTTSSTTTTSTSTTTTSPSTSTTSSTTTTSTSTTTTSPSTSTTSSTTTTSTSTTTTSSSTSTTSSTTTTSTSTTTSPSTSTTSSTTTTSTSTTTSPSTSTTSSTTTTSTSTTKTPSLSTPSTTATSSTETTIPSTTSSTTTTSTSITTTSSTTTTSVSTFTTTTPAISTPSTTAISSTTTTPPTIMTSSTSTTPTSSSTTTSLTITTTALTNTLSTTTTTFTTSRITMSTIPTSSTKSTTTSDPITSCRFSGGRICACGKSGLQVIDKQDLQLTLDKTSVSAYRRSKTSAPDTRVSAVSLGVCGIVVIALSIAAISLPDLDRLFRFFCQKGNDIEEKNTLKQSMAF